MAKFTQTYPTDFKYTEWQLMADYFPTYRLGRPRKWEMWQILNAILVERTFGWLGRSRRLARDFEHTVSSSESMVYLASIRRLLKLATN